MAGQAFELGEPGMLDGTTANSSPRTAAGHKQDDQIVKTKPLTRGAACGFWIRAWGQREPALQGTGRSSSPAQCGLAGARVDWTSRPLTPDATHFGKEHPIRTLTPHAWSLAGRIRVFVSHAIAASLN